MRIVDANGNTLPPSKGIALQAIINTGCHLSELCLRMGHLGCLTEEHWDTYLWHGYHLDALEIFLMAVDKQAFAVCLNSREG